MFKMVEISGRSHVFTLKDGSTFRIGARKSVPFDVSKMSADIERAIDRGLVYVTEVPSSQPKESNKKS